VAAISCAADLLSKHFVFSWLADKPGQGIDFIDGWLSFNLHINEGAVWGLGNEYPDLLLIVTALIIPAVVIMAYSYPCRNAPRWALGLLLGGAFGNLYDRVFTTVKLDYATQPISGVRDFIDMSVPGVYDWPVYNIADVAIVVGVVIYGSWSIFIDSQKKTESCADSVKAEDGCSL